MPKLLTEEQTNEAQINECARRICDSSSLMFTRYFFQKRFHRRFVVGDHHKIICDALDRVISGEITRLIINIAPRYSKTELVVKNFIPKGLAVNPAAKFIHLSYSDDLALDNSDEARTIVQSKEYQNIYPKVRIKARSDSKKKWYTTEGGGVYATSAAGQVTGFGAGLVDEEMDEQSALDEFTPTNDNKIFGGALIIDDPIKPEDADNETLRKKINARFDSTIVNRVNSRNTPIIIIMQRLHENDLCGYLTEKENHGWVMISLSCEADAEKEIPLWSFKHKWHELKEIEKRNNIVYERQYLQNPMPIAGRLYKDFKTYSIIPYDCDRRKAVIDVADTGKDYLCSIVYTPCAHGYYVLDVYYTQKGMEVTEQETAMQLTRERVDEARIESNNGGRGFARNVERICRDISNTHTSIYWFHQSDNKFVRIFTNAADVQNMIYYPEDWEKRWPAFASHVKGYMAIGKNTNDDAEDCLTMIIENEKNGSEGYIGR